MCGVCLCVTMISIPILSVTFLTKANIYICDHTYFEALEPTTYSHDNICTQKLAMEEFKPSFL